MSDLTIPKLDHFISFAKDDQSLSNKKAIPELNKLFSNMKSIAPSNEDDYREIWINVKRGTIEEFGSYEDYLEDGTVENREEFTNLWLAEYPDEIGWYKISSTSYKNNKYLFINSDLVYQITEALPANDFYDSTDIISGLNIALNTSIEMLKAGTYNNHVKENLPYNLRKGKILRNTLWDVFPEDKENYLKHISPEEIEQFEHYLTENKPMEYLKEMTSGLFFECCKYGYLANNYNVKELPAKECYTKFADGRHDGLLDINENSSAELKSWYKEAHGGHPYEVCRGGNSTHISLYIQHDENGWHFSLAGSSMGRSIETIKFYLALKEKGMPVELRDSHELLKMVKGEDYIGIVPKDIAPVYCSLMFPNENMLTFMNLPYEKTDEVIKNSSWYDIPDVQLIKERDDEER